MKRPSRTRFLLALFLLAPAPACAKMGSMADSAATPPMDTRPDATGMPSGGISLDDDMASLGTEAEMAPMAEPADEEVMAREVVASRGVAGSFGRRGRAGKKAGKASEGPAVQDPGAEPTEGDGASEGEPEPAIAADDTPDHGRHIVYTATMTIGVFDLEEAVEKAEQIPETYGGYIQSMSGGQLVLRIPSRHLRKAMSDLGGYGNVESRTLQAQDVTEEYVDLESRIRVLRETQNQLIDLLKKARTVEEALRVRQTLDQITMQLEQALGRLRHLQNMVGFSTLTLDLIERGPHQPTPTSNDPFPWVDTLGVESTEWRN